MGASKSASSSSKGGMSNKSASTNPVVQGIRADEYAKEKLGVTKMISNPNQPAVKGNVSGYMALNTGGNQMYGTQYQEARGEYLEKQGLATGRTVNYGPIDPATGKGKFSYTAYDTATTKDGKLTFTSKGRQAMESAKSRDIPLSKQMFESQNKFKLALAALTGIAGVPLIPTALVNQALGTSYTDYVQKREGGFYNKMGLAGNFLPSNKDNQSQQSNQTNQNEDSQFVASNRNKKKAGIGASDATQGRTFFS